MALFSHRVPADLRPTALARERERMGEVPFDLSLSNPTVCGLPYPPRLLDALADPRALRYRPDPLGERRARVAIAAEYRRWGLEVPAETFARADRFLDSVSVAAGSRYPYQRDQ